MNIGLDSHTLALGLLIVLSRITDVTAGTMRTISIVHGRTRTAFILGFFEVSLWLFVISTVLEAIMKKPILGLCYALGFSLGNVVGIKLEKRLAFGHTILRIFSLHHGQEMAQKVREAGYPVTVFQGQGESGPVSLLYIACRRRDVKGIVSIITNLEPNAFYMTEQAGEVSKIHRPFLLHPTGWRAILKKK